MVFNNVIVDVTISLVTRLCSVSRVHAKVPAGFIDVSSLAVAAFDLVYCFPVCPPVCLCP